MSARRCGLCNRHTPKVLFLHELHDGGDEPDRVPDDIVVTRVDLAFVLLSLLTYIADIVSDISVAVHYFRHSQVRQEG